MNDDLPTLRLKPGREGSVARRHPWIFSGAVANEPQGASPGDLVCVVSASGERLALAFWSPSSQIRARILSFDPGESRVGSFDWIAAKIGGAWARRATVWNRASHNAVRVVHGEADGMPGLVIDRYAGTLCAQILSCGFERRRTDIATALLDLMPDVSVVWERSEGKARAREGLPDRCGLLAERPGCGGDRPDTVLVNLNGIVSAVNLGTGQKTGSYLDQAGNHARVGSFAKSLDVLDAFCYDGGFALACLKAGAASVTALDASSCALEAFRANLERNGLEPGRTCGDVECIEGDAFDTLRRFRDSRRSFDLVVLDPPKLADAKVKVEKACRAYKDLNRLAFKLLRPGGLLATFSCSGAVDPALFATVVGEASVEAGRTARVIDRFNQPPDHPVSLTCPEGLYLKGLLCQVD
ncbi:MAG: class I SAM-dependent rRNA methyltransferase [Kiritimatiellae bacterium]|nr:class I SAM-dependent rRNA methyltransferase [Kiritimatiellia bacterium]